MDTYLRVSLQRARRRFTTTGVGAPKPECRWIAGACAVLATLVSAVLAEPQAPPAPCAGLPISACVPSPAVPVPANGAIAVAAPPGEDVVVNVYDELGGIVPGSLVMIAQGMWAWHATDQPAPGAYEVEVIDHMGA